jgi:hypothetical protein
MFLGVCAKSLPLEVCRLHTHGGAENILQKMTLLEQLLHLYGCNASCAGGEGQVQASAFRWTRREE